MKFAEGRFERIADYKKNTEGKIEQWNFINAKVKNKDSLSEGDFIFLLREIHLTYEPSLSEATPYLYNHVPRIKYEFTKSHAIIDFQSVFEQYFKSIESIMELKLAIFGRKKVIDTAIEIARNTLKETEKTAQILNANIHGEYNYLDKWEENKDKWEKLNHQFTIKRPFLPQDIQWMLVNARSSIEYQVETGELNFMHKAEKRDKELKSVNQMLSFGVVFRCYQKAFERIATEPIPLLDTGQHLDRMKGYIREAEKGCLEDIQNIKEYL